MCWELGPNVFQAVAVIVQDLYVMRVKEEKSIRIHSKEHVHNETLYNSLIKSNVVGTHKVRKYKDPFIMV